jgi:YidC/Oxa1 family membrane protein insertase
MDQKRLFLAIAASIAILLVFQVLLPHPAPTPSAQHVAANIPAAEQAEHPGPDTSPATQPAEITAPRVVPRVKIDAPSVLGSISLVGARIDDVVLRDYHETVSKTSPLVKLLEPLSDPQPYFAQFGWSAANGETAKLPDSTTLWTASASTLTTAQPVTLSWNNGEGLIFELIVSIDDHYMFHVEQRVQNMTGKPVSLYPWGSIHRNYTPKTIGYYILHEGPVGVVKDVLQEITYPNMRSEGQKNDGIAYQGHDTGGWAGITDQYWLAAVVPGQSMPVTITYRYLTESGQPHYQVDYIAQDAVTVAPGATMTSNAMLFAGAKIVALLDRYEAEYHIPSFDKAVDFGWFYFLTKPIFFALDWLNTVLGNFGLAIMAFTLFVKLLFFPLANKSYRSMSKMKLLGPKVQALRERLKDDPAKMQQEMMALYRTEKVNPASGCLPMIIQIPVFFSLYKDIFVTIEMRHAPFFGWIRDMSVPDPTNVFNLFGLLPFDPTTISPFLHLGAWPLIMGFSMFLQQRLNPPPPDPMQARLFQFMPVVFTFMLARFPAGLVIYWTWNNLLTVGQQWLIMRSTRLTSPRMART